MKSQLIAIVAAMLLVGCGKSQDTDLNGKWLGKGYTCSVGDVKSDQEISISQDGDKVVATKITGDECVKAGEKTWEGKISGDWIEGVIYGWAANSPKPIPQKARIEIKSSNLLYFAPAGLEFVRIPDAEASKPEPPKGKAPDISIHDAAEEGNIEAVKQHLAAGTDVDAWRYGTTPLHKAARNGQKETAELLIAKGADLNAKNNVEWTPLHGAARGGHKEIVELLIAKGADVNAKDDDGRTPLYYAANHGHKVIVEPLIANGADVNPKDEDGETPLDWAIDRKHPETAALLRKHGGKTGEELKAEGK